VIVNSQVCWLSLIVIGALLFGYQVVPVTQGGSDGLVAGTFRCGGLFLIVFAVFPESRSTRGMTWKHWGLGAFSAACGYLFPAAYTWTTVAIAITVSYSGMLFRPFVHWAMTGIPVTLLEIVQLGIAAAGVVCAAAATSGGEPRLVGGILALGAAISWAWFATGHHKMKAPKNVLTWPNLLGALLGAVTMLLRDKPLPVDYAPHISVGLTASTAFLLFALANPHVSPVRSSLVSVIEVPAAIYFAWKFLGVPVEPLHWVGCGLIMLANAFAAATDRRQA